MLTLVTGAAGFIGSHLVDRLLERGCHVIGLDNFTRGVRSNLHAALQSPYFKLVECDIAKEDSLARAVDMHLQDGARIEMVWHMAANSDIPAGVTDPHVDLKDTFMTTFNLLKVMKSRDIRRIAFASSSAVYGELACRLSEETGPLLPISNYGAMKLAGEGAISAAAEAFLDRAWIYRFPNVVGGRGTHGVIYDLLGKLARHPNDLEVLGDGRQKKPYLHVSELVAAMLFIQDKAPEKIALYNIGPEDDGVEVADIAQAVLDAAKVDIPLRFTGGDRGWVGDVPRFTYSIEKLKNLGWRPKMKSADAIRKAAEELALERKGKT
jgi:UDP-glucose 4-epimerase